MRLGRASISTSTGSHADHMGSHAEHMRSAAGRRRTAVRVVGRDTGDDELDDELLATYRRRYGDLIEVGWAANPEHGPGQRGQRRRPRLTCLADRSVRPGVASLDAAVIGGAEVADSLARPRRPPPHPTLQPGGQGSRCGPGELSISYRSEMGALILPASIHISSSTRSTVATFVSRSTWPAKATRRTSFGSLEETGYPGHEGLAGERASGHRTRVMP